MKICIISDLHCKYQQDISNVSDTFLISNKARIPANQHPVASFITRVASDPSIMSDLLICPGDLGDKADEQGIASSWTFLEEMKGKVGAKLLIGIPGNHDINSRKKNNKDAFTYIQNFHEGFPTTTSSLNTQFWHNGFCILNIDRTLILLINTVHDHNDAEKAKESYLKEGALENLKQELEKLDSTNFDFKICVMHHHPIKHSNIHNYKDGDSFEHGDNLISILVGFKFSMVIHGHKHQPRIVEYDGMPVFAAGSFSSVANLQGTGLSTMFHVVELKPNSTIGTIRSWEYDVVDGWTQKLNKAFPPRIGFGSQTNVEGVAEEINKKFNEGNGAPLLYSTMVTHRPDLEFLIPEKLKALDRVLEEKYNLSTSPRLPLTPEIITKIIK